MANCNLLSEFFTGKITIPDNRFEYCLFDNSTIGIRLISIDDIFNRIYKESPNSRIHIKIESNDKYNEFDDIDVKGVLFKKKNSVGIYEWHIGRSSNNEDTSFCIGDWLFNNTGSKVNITIDDMDYYLYKGKCDNGEDEYYDCLDDIDINELLGDIPKEKEYRNLDIVNGSFHLKSINKLELKNKFKL